MNKILGWSARKLRTRTILTGLLLLTAQASIALAMNNLVRGLDLPLVLTVTILGLLIGWVIARTNLPGGSAGFLLIALGVGIDFARVGQQSGTIILLFEESADFIFKIINWRIPSQVLDARPVLQIASQLATDTSALAARWRDWLVALATGTPSFDPVAAALTWCFVLWMLATFAAWAVYRREQPFIALLPGIAFLGTMLAYAGGNPGYLFPGLSALLLLMILTNAGARERRWNLDGIDFAEDIRFDLAVMGVLVSFLLIVAAAAVPSVSVSQIARSMQRWLTPPATESNRIYDSLGLVPQPKPSTVFDAIRMPGLPRSHLIGAGPELSEQLVMTVQTDDPVTSPAPGYYWRSSTYERYTGFGWATDANEIVAYRAGDQAITQFHQNMRAVQQQVQVQSQVGGLLFATGTLVTADHDFQIEWRSQPDGDFFGANIGANTYQVESLVPTASELELRITGSNYPAWIRTRYLGLPNDVPTRVLSLARDLTATAPTPYDRARAIETFLRGFPYTLDLPAPPLNRDVVDYFLFDLKRGYCDYYASAMVVLARAAGLPARLVVGYATGTYDSTNARYVVTEADAHSWVEIYFPDYGWIEFEPTGGREPIDRLAQSIAPERHTTGEKPGQLSNAQTMRTNNWWLVLPVGMGLSMLGIFIWMTLGAWRLDRLAPEPAIQYIYGQLCRHSHRLGLETRASNTPDEIARELIDRLTQIVRGVGGTSCQPAQRQVQHLIDTYAQMRYSPYRPDGNIKKQSIDAWEHLRWRLWYAWVVQSYRKWVKR